MYNLLIYLKNKYNVPVRLKEFFMFLSNSINISEKGVGIL